MRKNTKLIAISIAVIVVLLGVAVFFIQRSTNVKERGEKKNQVNIKVDDSCEYKEGHEVFEKATEQQDTSICDCIEESELKYRQYCKDSVMDVIEFKQAVFQLDDSLCNNIMVESGIEECRNVVNNKIKELKKEDPEYLAQVYLATHDERSIEVIEGILAKNKDDVEFMIQLSTAYAEKGLNEQNKGGDQTIYVNKALKLLEDAKAIDASKSEIYRVEGYVYEIKPDFVNAVISYDKALELDQKNALAYAGKGHVLRMTGRLPEAVDEFNKAAKIDVENEYSHIYINLCNLEYSRSGYEEAKKNCEIVMQMEWIDPSFKSEAYQIMASMYMTEGDLIKANDYLTKAKTYTANDPNLYITFTELNLLEKNYDEAEKNANKAIEITSSKAVNFLFLARVFYAKNNYDEAIQTATRGISLLENDVSLLGPAKPATERDLNNVIADSYGKLGNLEKQQEHQQISEKIFINK